MLHSSPYYFTTIKIWTKISVAIRLQGLKISSGLTTIHCYRIKQHTYADLEYVLSNNINLNEHKYQNQTIWILVSGDLWTWGGGGGPQLRRDVSTRNEAAFVGHRQLLETDPAAISQHPESWRPCEWAPRSWKGSVAVGTTYSSLLINAWKHLEW